MDGYEAASGTILCASDQTEDHCDNCDDDEDMNNSSGVKTA